MGTSKAALAIRGEPILQFILRRIDWPGPTLLVTAPGRENPPGAERFDREVHDPVADQGPLRGVLTALKSMETASAIVIAVDMPAVMRSDLEWLVDNFAARPQAAALMTRRDGQIEPLPCVMRESAIALVEEHLGTGRRSLNGLTSDSRVLTIDASARPGRAWLNVNTPDDWNRFLADLPD